ncbi:uncharacterized protein LOC126971019 [Leptidea sinapis]|uniref:uncharacterized protein LOC126971019 n=1 Tax=Leptidea sinapis TaxID=189913 RepID=UPI00213E05C4|nr:uncharacterized protein LOC126971019 [Leptidea sinapis]
MEAFECQPYDWLKEASIYNKNYTLIPVEWFKENADVIVLLFTANGLDKDGIVEKFYSIYENVKLINIPIEVIYIPMDETEEDMMQCFERQANWFTLKIYDPLVQVLKYMYGITYMPTMFVIRPDLTLVSMLGVMELEQHGKDAIITWLSSPLKLRNRQLENEKNIYGNEWKYANVDKKKEYRRRFNIDTTNDAT